MKAYLKVEKGKNAALKNITLGNLSWVREHKDALASIQNSLREAFKLFFSKPVHVICIYTDASEALWVVITQKKGEQLEKPVEDQQREPVAFSGD